MGRKWRKHYTFYLGVGRRIEFGGPGQNVRQVVLTSQPEKAAVGEVGFHLRPQLRLGQTVVMHDKFKLEQQHGLHAGAADVGVVEFLNRLAEAEEIIVFFGPPHPVVASDERVKHGLIRRRNHRRLVRSEHGIPFPCHPRRLVRRHGLIQHPQNLGYTCL